jgi:hypothetical protein
MKKLIRCLILLFGVVAFGRAAVDESVVAKIVVKADGALYFDGKKTELRELEGLLKPIQEKHGVVWYYRASPRAEPHPVALEVLKLVMAKQIPIKLFSKEDFSEYVGADGKPQKQRKG